jgi:hypothetical protein
MVVLEVRAGSGSMGAPSRAATAIARPNQAVPATECRADQRAHPFVTAALTAPESTRTEIAVLATDL